MYDQVRRVVTVLLEFNIFEEVKLSTFIYYEVVDILYFFQCLKIVFYSIKTSFNYFFHSSMSANTSD